MFTHKGTQDKGGKNEKGGQEEGRKARSRIRPVDFMSVEDTMHGHALSPFELKVKEKIAAAPSPVQEWIKREEAQERNQTVKNALSNLIQKAKLTPRQKACYELVYLEELSDGEIAEKLCIAERNVRRLKRSVFKALKRAHEEEEIKTAACAHPLTEKQHLLIRLRYEDRLSRREIAEKLHMTLWAVDKLLLRVRKKIFPEKKVLKCPSA